MNEFSQLNPFYLEAEINRRYAQPRRQAVTRRRRVLRRARPEAR